MTTLPPKRLGWLLRLVPRLFTAVALLVAGGLSTALVWRATNTPPRKPEDHYYKPSGYIEKVKALVEDRKLRLTGKPEFADFDQSRLDRYDLEFIRHSQVEKDVQRLNDDLTERAAARTGGDDELPEFSGLLSVAVTRKGSRLVVRDRPVRIPLPFAVGTQNPTATVIGSGEGWKLCAARGCFTVVASETPEYTQHELWSPPDNLTAPKLALYELPGSDESTRGRRLVELAYTPEGVAVEIKSTEVQAFIDGQSAIKRTFTLTDGAVLGLTDSQHKIVFVCRRADASLLASASATGDESEDVDPPAPGTPERLVWDFDRGRQSHQRGPLQEARFTQTIDLELNGLVQRTLETFVAKANQSVEPQYRYRPASVALLNPKTGDLVALASYPTESTPEPPGIPYETRVRRLKNQNFFTHPVGSCGKPFMAASIYDVYPPLAELRLSKVEVGAGNEVNSTLGLKISPTYDDTAAANFTWSGRGFELGRDEFFKHSVNTYFIDLFLLSLACDASGQVAETTTDGTGRNLRNVFVNGRTLGHQPRFGVYLKGGEVFDLEKHPPSRKLAQVFDVAIDSSEQDDAAQNYDLTALQAAASLVPPREALMRWGRPGLAPERVNLNFAGMTQFRGELLSYLFGGGSGRWTNIKMAEAMARLITGRKVVARLIRQNDEALPQPAFPEVELTPATLKLMRQSLQGASSEGGTAGALADTLKSWNAQLASRGLSVRCYSKTGTWHREHKTAKSGAKDHNSGTYVFYLSVNRGDGVELTSLAGVVNIEDRGSSQIAVALAEHVIVQLRDSYFASTLPPPPSAARKPATADSSSPSPTSLKPPSKKATR